MHSEQSDIFISRLLALFFSVISAVSLLYVGALAGLIASEATACLSLLVLGSIKMRVGVRKTYSHPLGTACLLCLMPALGVILLMVFSGRVAK
ncbi:MAG: hypothetical protein QM813_06445 [Verrucomicrobiota bacterium]